MSPAKVKVSAMLVSPEASFLACGPYVAFSLWKHMYHCCLLLFSEDTSPVVLGAHLYDFMVFFPYDFI